MDDADDTGAACRVSPRMTGADTRGVAGAIMEVMMVVGEVYFRRGQRSGRGRRGENDQMKEGERVGYKKERKK